MKKKMIKKFVSGVTVMSLILASVPFNLYAATDTTGHWAKTYMDKLVSEKVLTGDPSGALRPDKAITRAEFITMMNKVFGYVDKNDNTFTDVSSTDWFLGEMQKATKAGYIAGYTDGTAKPNGAITRQEAAFAMWKAFGLTAGSSDTLKKFSDSSSIQDYARDAVASLVEHNAISGYPEGNFKPAGTITRAEASTILARFADVYSTAGTYGDSGSTISGNLVVNTPDVILSGMTINGDLYIAPGVDEGDATLNNVVVKGTTYVQGGGVNSVKVIDSKLKDVKVKKINNKPVRVLAQGKTDIGTVTLGSSAKLVESGMNVSNQGFNAVQVSKMIEGALSIILDGAFTTVNMASSGDFQLASGTISSMQVPAGVVVTVKTGTGAVISSISAVSPITVNGTAVSSNSTVGVSSTGNVSTSTGNNSNGGYSGGGSSGGGYGGGSGVVTTPTTALLTASLNPSTTSPSGIAYLKVTGNGTSAYVASAVNVKSIVMAGTSTNVSGAASVSTISAANGIGTYAGQVQLTVGASVPVGDYTVNYADSALTGATTKQSVVLSVVSGKTTATAVTASADGEAGSKTSTQLTLTLNNDPGLVYNDITIAGGTTGAVKGSATSFASLGSGVYGLSLSGIKASGQITVSIANKAGYTITNPAPVMVSFEGITSISGPYALGTTVVAPVLNATPVTTAPTALTGVKFGTVAWTGMAGSVYAVGDTPVATFTATTSAGYGFDSTTWKSASATSLVTVTSATSVDINYVDAANVQIVVHYPKLTSLPVASLALGKTVVAPVFGAAAIATAPASVTGAQFKPITWTGVADTSGYVFAIGDKPVATFTATTTAGYNFDSTTWKSASATSLVTVTSATSVDINYVDAGHVEIVVHFPAMDLTKIASLTLGKAAVAPVYGAVSSTTVTIPQGLGVALKGAGVWSGVKDTVNNYFDIGDMPIMTFKVTTTAGYTFDPTTWKSASATSLVTVTSATSVDINYTDSGNVEVVAHYPQVISAVASVTLSASKAPTIADATSVPVFTAGTKATVSPSVVWTGLADQTASAKFAAGDTPVATFDINAATGVTFDTTAIKVGTKSTTVKLTGADVEVTAVTPTKISVKVVYPTLGAKLTLIALAGTVKSPKIGDVTVTTAPTPGANMTAGTITWTNVADKTDSKFAAKDVPVATFDVTAAAGYIFDPATWVSGPTTTLVTLTDTAATVNITYVSATKVTVAVTYPMLTTPIADLTLVSPLVSPAIDDSTGSFEAPVGIATATFSTVAWSGKTGSTYADGDAPIATFTATATAGNSFDATTWATGTSTLVKATGGASVKITRTDATHVIIEVTFTALSAA